MSGKQPAAEAHARAPALHTGVHEETRSARTWYTMLRVALPGAIPTTPASAKRPKAVCTATSSGVLITPRCAVSMRLARKRWVR